MSYRILTIDPGSTSTKIGVFDHRSCLTSSLRMEYSW